MRRALVLSLVFACGRSKGEAPPVARTGAEADALWALAPPGAQGGVVVTAHGITELEKAFVRLRGEIATYPELAAARGQLAALRWIGLDGDRRLADIGLTADQGFAMFGTARDALMILPVVDRQKFVTAIHGTSTGDVDLLFGVTCRQLAQRYACAKDPALFEGLAKGSLVGKLAAGGRGDVEIWMSGAALDKAVDGLSIAAVLDDGVLDVHAYVATTAWASAPLHGLGPDPRGGGFLRADLSPAFATMSPGDRTAEVVSAFEGPFEATMSTSALAFLARAPLAKTAPVQDFIEHCNRLDGFMNISLVPDHGICRIGLPMVVPMAVEAWVEDGELRIAQKRGAFEPGTGSERTVIGKELAGYPFAVWGRGSLFALHLSKLVPVDAIAKLPDAEMMLRELSQVSEIGMAARPGADGVQLRAYLRTTWANPTEVADGVAAISVAEVLAGTGDERAAKLAADHPDAPFARDLAAGPGGMMMPTTVLGIASAVAIPAFLDYKRKARVTEANLKLRQIGANAKTYFITNGAFPKGTAEMTPSAPCCGQPGNKCAPADWSAGVWKALDFQITEATKFQYSYASDGESFNATAVGDLDCDGIAITYNLSGVAENGKPRTTLSEPPPNSD